QTVYGGSFGDAFVAKLNAAGNALLYSTYLGGSGFDVAGGITVDGAGNTYVAGNTASPNFPTTTGALQTVHGGSNAFVAKLNAAGNALLYSTYLGGSGQDGASGIAVDGAGNAYVAGGTSSPNFPTTPGALQTVFGGGFEPEDAFVAKLNAAGN